MGMRAAEHEHNYVCIHIYILNMYSIYIIYVYRILYSVIYNMPMLNYAVIHRVFMFVNYLNKSSNFNSL